MITLYGIPNCDRVRAARKWLEQQNISYRFHDVRATVLPRAQLQQWVEQLGFEALVNRRSTTWRQIPPSVREHLSADSAIELLQTQPTLMKRPVLEINSQLTVGYDEDEYRRIMEPEHV